MIVWQRSDEVRSGRVKNRVHCSYCAYCACLFVVRLPSGCVVEASQWISLSSCLSSSCKNKHKRWRWSQEIMQIIIGMHSDYSYKTSLDQIKSNQNKSNQIKSTQITAKCKNKKKEKMMTAGCGSRSHLLSTSLLLRVKTHLKQHCEYLT